VSYTHRIWHPELASSMLLLCTSHAKVWCTVNNFLRLSGDELHNARGQASDLIKRWLGTSDDTVIEVQRYLDDCCAQAFKELSTTGDFPKYAEKVEMIAADRLYSISYAAHTQGHIDIALKPHPAMDVEESEEPYVPTVTSLGKEAPYIPTVLSPGKRKADSYLAAAKSIESISAKKSKRFEDPKFSWYQEIEDDALKKVIANFSTSAEVIRRGILGASYERAIALPKNFDACFGQTGATLRALIQVLGIKVVESAVTLDPTQYQWSRVLSDPTSESMEALKKSDPKQELSNALLNLIEAVEFLTSPHIVVESRPGIDFVRFLMCKSHQEQYNSKLQSVESTFKYTSKTQKVFEDMLMNLTPNLPEVARVLCTILERIVQHFFLPVGEKAYKAVNKVIDSFYVEDRSVMARSYNTTTKQRLTSEGKKVLQRKGKPQPRHYEPYQAIVKPSIETSKVPVTTEELTVIKSINQQLQTLETHCVLPKTNNQKLRKNSAHDIITLYHEKCRKVERVFTARRQQIHNSLKADRQKALDARNASDKERLTDRSLPFTSDEWKAATERLLSTNNDLIQVLNKEFKLMDSLIPFNAINQSFFTLTLKDAFFSDPILGAEESDEED